MIATAPVGAQVPFLFLPNIVILPGFPGVIDRPSSLSMRSCIGGEIHHGYIDLFWRDIFQRQLNVKPWLDSTAVTCFASHSLYRMFGIFS